MWLNLFFYMYKKAWRFYNIQYFVSDIFYFIKSIYILPTFSVLFIYPLLTKSKLMTDSEADSFHIVYLSSKDKW